MFSICGSSKINIFKCSISDLEYATTSVQHFTSFYLFAVCQLLNVEFTKFGGLGMDSKNSTFNLPTVIELFLLSLNIEAPLFSPVENE